MAVEAEESDMHRQLSRFASALSAFSSSADTFRILTSIPQTSSPSPTPPPPATLYVLDSSFNPPTLAHLRIATSALTQDRGSAPKRLLLLLATQNADKAPKPASFEQRLTLMNIFAHDLRNAYHTTATTAATAAIKQSQSQSQLQSQTQSKIDQNKDLPAIDIGVTKHPYFIDKAASIAASGHYPPETTTQVHLVGYDTLIRILNPKYYTPTKTLAPLDPFLSTHRLRVTFRTGGGGGDADAGWGGRAEQEAYLVALARGEREDEGGKREWAERIELVEGRREEGEGEGGEGKEEEEEVVSSTRVREAVRAGGEGLLWRLVTKGVADWVLKERLYVND